MITLHLTEQGQQAIEDNLSLHFVTFVASDSFDSEDMELWRTGSYSGNKIFRQFPVAYINITPKGKIYSEGHTSYMLDHTVVDIVGAIETYNIDRTFEINSIGIIATTDEESDIDSIYSFIYAFGSLELNTYPLPANKRDTLTYIIPFQVSYGDIVNPDLTAPDNLAPWKTFLEHKYKQVTNPTQVHNLYIDLNNMKFRVDSTTFSIPSAGGEDLDRRIAGIWNALTDAVYYKPEEELTANTTFAAIDVGRNEILDSKIKVLGNIDVINKNTLYGTISPQINSKANAIIRQYCNIHWSTNEVDWTQGLEDEFVGCSTIFIIPCSYSWYTSRMVYTINYQNNNCYFYRNDASQDTRIQYWYIGIK